MGIAAAVAFQPDVSGEENAARMTEAANHVKTGTVTYAVRDSEYNGVQIHKDDIIGMHNGQIEYSGDSVHDVVMEMMKAIVEDGDEMITVYYGADTSKEDAEAITAEIGEQYPDCEMRPPSIVGACELNFCVRDGNRWTLAAINTNSYGWLSPSFISKALRLPIA